MEKILEIKNLHTTFLTSKGKVSAVRGVSFSIDRGEILGLVGESGSGKSVTSMSVLKLLPENAMIESEHVIFDGIDISGFKAMELRDIRGNGISMIFQDPMSSLNPLIKTGKQVAEMIRIHHPAMSPEEIKSRVLELFSSVKIPEPEKRYDSYPHELSGGMRQRVMIAMAMANRPKLMIADEPTTALDVTIQNQILLNMRQLQEESGTSILFITHDLAVVAELCHRVIVMYGGLIMEEAPVELLFKKPLHPYTLGLMASIPNIDQQKNTKLTPIPGSPPDMTAPPAGCPFAPRCPYARVICRDELPELASVGEKHFSRCHLLSDEAPAQNNPFKQDGDIK